VDRLIAHADHIIVVVRTVRQKVRCPDCAQPSHRIHSYYERRLADLPWNGIPVRICLRTRRFFCDGDGCARQIFTERLPETASTHARRTLRMEQALRWLGLALGGAAGARTAQRLGLVASGDTLLRHLRRLPRTPTATAPRVLGMDDWAWRKGQRYGTILCDLERHRVVDLLPARQSSTVTAWLRDHAPPEVISRDRAGAYAEAAHRGAPRAVQVADRFHLVRNLREALEHVLTRHTAVIEQAFLQSTPAPMVPPPPPIPPTPSLTRSPQLSRERRQRRLERYQQVMALQQRGLSKRAIARQLGLERKTVPPLVACRPISRAPSPATTLLRGPMALVPGTALGGRLSQSQPALAGTGIPRSGLCRRHLAPLVPRPFGSARASFTGFACPTPEAPQSAAMQCALARSRSQPQSITTKFRRNPLRPFSSDRSQCRTGPTVAPHDAGT